MAAVAADFLTLASGLLADPQAAEAHRRAAINRAYYAAYHAAFIYAEEVGLEVIRTNTGLHQQLVERFSSGGRRHRVVGDRLASLKRLRADADYKLTQKFSLIDAQKHLSGCVRLIDELARLREATLAKSV